MRILDKHILKELLIPVVFALYTLVFLFIVGDLFDNLYEIINNKSPLPILITYYLYLIPFAITQTISWATLLGIIYLFVSLKRHGEIIAMKACGLKITQIAAPLIFLGIIISVMTFLLNERVVPWTLQNAQNIKKEWIDISGEKDKTHTIQNVTLLSNNRQYFIKTFDQQHMQIDDVRIHILDENKSVAQKIVAQKGRWKNNAWLLEKVSVYNLDASGRIVGEPEVAETRHFPEFSEIPRDFIEASIDSTLMNSKKLISHIKRLKNNGLTVTAESSAFHHKRAFPWQSLIIMLITIPLLGKTGNVRENLAKNVLICLISVLCYHVSAAVFLALGKSGILMPSVSAWSANLLFAITGIALLEKANY